MKYIHFFLPSFLILMGCRNETPSSVWWEGFEKPAANPVLTADSSYQFFCPVQSKLVRWQRADVFNPAAVVRNDSLYLLFRAEDNPKAAIGGRTSRIGLAVSTDGLHFQKYKDPVLYPDSTEFIRWDFPGGCEDPRVVTTEEGSYVMTYTSWNGDVARLSAATSNDLYHWQKQGPIFEEAYNGKFLDTWSKSGSIVCKQEGDQLVATRINGKYWMYWGDLNVYMATSDNLLDWTPVIAADSSLKVIMPPRDGKFDSELAEPGPPALLTDNGILLFYNGKNDEGERADPSIPKGTYCAGQALFSPDAPEQLLDRQEVPFIKPSLAHETSGQYQSGTTFIEGLVPYKGQWFLYYGTADSMVGVAVL